MPRRVLVIGGGISGLATAHRLAELSRSRELGLSITLLEARERLGGTIETQRRGGFLLEAGPDAFLAEKPWATELCQRLGIADQLIETQPAYRRSFIVRQGRLMPVPAGWFLLAPARWQTLFEATMLSWPGRLRMALEPLIPPRRHEADESLGAFVRRRFGREALERIGQPMIGGIYTADPDRLSLQATMPRFAEMERSHGSVLRALRSRAQYAERATAAASGPRYQLFVTLRGGMQTLIEALERRMPEVSLRRRALVTRIDAGWTVTLQGGETLAAEALCLALPAQAAAGVVDRAAPSLAKDLAGIPYESVATVHMAFRVADVPRPLDGFGFVAPAVERRKLIGCTFTSMKFPGRAPDAAVLLRAFVGGALHRPMFDLDDGAMIRMVRGELRDLLGIHAEPMFSAVHRFRQAMPQYHVGHLKRLEAIDVKLARHPGLFVTGNGYRGIGIPDCVHQGERVAERMVEYLMPPREGSPTTTGAEHAD